MTHTARFCTGLCLALMWLGVSASAQAQTDDELAPATHTFISSERVVMELRGGPYTPNMDGNSSFKNLYGTDIGPLLDVEIDAIAYRLPKILYLTVGGSAGHVGYSAHAFDVTGVLRVSEKSTFSMFPLAALGTLRIDALARRLGLPFVLTGKIGWEWAHWSTATGSRSDADGWSTGLVYGGQFALDLDSFEPSAARRMDEEWGINHSFLFFELLTFSPTKKALPIGGTNWLIGLGFIF